LRIGFLYVVKKTFLASCWVMVLPPPREAALLDVRLDRLAHRVPVDPLVAEEVRILGGHHRVDEVARDPRERHPGLRESELAFGPPGFILALAHHGRAFGVGLGERPHVTARGEAGQDVDREDHPEDEPADEDALQQPHGKQIV